MTNTHWAIDIDRDNIKRAELVKEEQPSLHDGEIEVAVNSYAITANNITYAVFGKPNGLFGPDAGYWDFFAPRETPGRLPIWGFATVTRSACDGVTPGERFYGFYPMASHAVLVPQRVGAGGFTDGTPRRAALPLVYNQYQRLEALADYRPEHHDYWPVFRPLFLTGWLISDQFEDEHDYGTEQILVASASSKTAIGLGFSMGCRVGKRPQTVGMTSAANVDALDALGIYDRVISYDAIATLDPAIPSALVDMAGNGDVTGAVHRHFGDALLASIVVGKSHWDAAAGDAKIPGPARQGFFAPGRVQKRIGDWGAAGFGGHVASAWLAFMEQAPRIATIDARDGGDAALAAYTQVLDGRADPKVGIIIRP
ncbi:MAG: DUF2855 family protein [Pseudomonadota bacterium]